MQSYTEDARKLNKEKKAELRAKREEALLKALGDCLGNVTAATRLAGVPRDFFYQCYNSDEKFREKFNEILDMRLDFAEGKLMELIDLGNPQTVMFFLKTQGKKRGYTEKQEIVTTNVDLSNDIDFSSMTNEELETFSALCMKYRKKD